MAIVGAREIPPAEEGPLKAALRSVLETLDQTLIDIEVGTKTRFELAEYYSPAKPTLRLISGLADGTDQLVSQLFLDMPAAAVHEIAAVLPSEAERYRERSAVQNEEAFRSLLKQCVWRHQLDGRFPEEKLKSGSPDDVLLYRRCRARAFRAQADIMLRQCDVLLAVSDPGAPARAGGTRETIVAALALHLPVIHVSLVDCSVRLIETRTELDEAPFRTGGDDLADVKAKIIEMLAAPYRVPPAHEHKPLAPGELTSEERRFFAVYFADQVPPPGALNHIWSLVEHLLRAPPPVASELENDALTPYRMRAGKLSAYYSGRYRGAFLVNYTLALVAVALAVASLFFVLPIGHIDVTTAVILGVLGAAKLAIVVTIYATTAAANRGQWNRLAVDFRYVAERLRAMNYLPRVHLLRPPVPSTTRATRRLAQTSADWLALAAVRYASQASAKLDAPDAASGLDAIATHWVANQIAYHRATAHTMERLSAILEGASSWLNATVIAIVALDLLLLAAAAFEFPTPGYAEIAHSLSPFYIYLAAVLPAAVAGANGIRFQSESDRLAERSASFANILSEVQSQALSLRKEALLPAESRAAERDLGGWFGSAALMAETFAQLFLDEVAEWSVLYAKNLAEA